MMTNVEEHLVAATHHILKAVGANKNVSDDFRRVLTQIESLLSAMSPIAEGHGAEFTVINERLKHAERKVMQWESNSSLIWDSGPDEALEYLQAVNEIQTVIECLGSLPVNGTGKKRELAFRAECALQIAMSRLEEELFHIFVQHKQLHEPQYMSFRSHAAEVVYDESIVSVEDEIVAETSRRESSSNGESLEYTVDLVDPLVIPHIQSIANSMFASNYGKEFCDTFVGIRREALDGYCSILEMEKVSIEDVLKIEWDSLSNKIKTWMSAMKIIVRVYLPSEKRLCDQILGDFGSVNSFCFVQISKASVLHLLNFGEAVAMEPHKPEKLYRLLDVYELLADLQLDIDGLFSEDVGSFIRIEFHELLKSFSVSARETFLKFGNVIASYASTQPFPGGGVFHLTRYVMNYINILTEYHRSLNLILRDQNEGVEDSKLVVQTDNVWNGCPATSCPMAFHLQAIASTLESSLTKMSRLYKDESLQHFFLMNNIHYMVEKVKDSELIHFFGDEWTRKLKAKCQQNATSYVRSTWSPVISLLRDDGKTTHKERCKRFNNAFEEVHKSQTKWCIQDHRLREDLQILTSQKVILAYRAFIGNNGSNIDEKYIKYPCEDLENMFLDLFVGSSKSLRNSRRW